MNMSAIHVLLAVGVSAIALPAVAQERFQLLIPGEGTSVSFIAPAVTEFQGQRQGERFRFLGVTDVQTRVVISLFAEPWMSGGDSLACRTEFWTQGSRNPAIVKDSIKQVDVSGRPGVSYLLEGEHQGVKVRSRNVNVYVVQAGKCFDFHLSQTPDESPSEQQMMAIGASLLIEPAKSAQD